MKLPTCDCTNTKEQVNKLIQAHRSEWDRLTADEKSWLKRQLTVEVQKGLRHVGKFPPCQLELPIVVDQDFQYLYRELRIDPNLVKRVSKGADNVEPEQEDLAGTPS